MSEVTRADLVAMLRGARRKLKARQVDEQAIDRTSWALFAVIDGALEGLETPRVDATNKEGGGAHAPVKISSLSRPQSDFYRGRVDAVGGKMSDRRVGPEERNEGKGDE